MELKTYQKNVISDLARFLSLLTECGKISKAYTALWEEKNVMVGMNGMPYYKTNLPGVPEVCLKVPTGGGKTFLAANAIKTIYDSMPVRQAKAVVWLVPSDAILNQTYAALSNPDHPYRQKIDVDFSGAVEVYSKMKLLNGQNFNPTVVTEQLSIFVLSYDSFRTSKKDGRKAYQENGNLSPFSRIMPDKSVLLKDVDETALIQVIRCLNPVVIVDESHHAESKLSKEMLENFNPCFVLDLTATPKKDSNVISFVDAAQLKKANMVKLPVIVYNRKSQDDVYSDAIHIRQKLEEQAQLEQAVSGRYIRPIVLFQAQANTGADSTTYEKIKSTLIERGIPKEHIAIKTADKDELKNVDLKSPACLIRYIITVNALKEGWDCPFAYVLATVANRTSSVDVEQILGRVLRLPDAAKNQNPILNMSYVITSSTDFSRTLEKVVVGLNNAGFSSKDYRAKDMEPAPQFPENHDPMQLEIQTIPTAPETESENTSIPTVSWEKTSWDDIPSTPVENPVDELLSAAIAQGEAYENTLASAEMTAVDMAPMEVRDKMNQFRMNDCFAEEAAALRFPQFMLQVPPSLFHDSDTVLLEKEHLSEGFTLRDKDVQIDFATLEAEMARVDVDDGTESAPKVWKINGADNIYLKEWFQSRPPEHQVHLCKNTIKKRISKINCINDKELDDYIDRVVNLLSTDQLAQLRQSPYLYAQKVEEKVKSLLAIHQENLFDLWLEQGIIVCQPNYQLKSVISPVSFTKTYPHSLYSAEEDFNDYERKIVWELSSKPNVKWWHRNISRLGFCINGSIHAYPDLIVMTTSGKLLMIEAKGDHLDNDESKAKAKLGAQWASLAGGQYRYFMVFESKSPAYPGAYSYERFMEILKAL